MFMVVFFIECWLNSCALPNRSQKSSTASIPVASHAATGITRSCASWLRSLPVQVVALMLVTGLVCALDPDILKRLTNFTLTISPELCYVNGPPTIWGPLRVQPWARPWGVRVTGHWKQWSGYKSVNVSFFKACARHNQHTSWPKRCLKHLTSVFSIQVCYLSWLWVSGCFCHLYVLLLGPWSRVENSHPTDWGRVDPQIPQIPQTGDSRPTDPTDWGW